MHIDRSMTEVVLSISPSARGEKLHMVMCLPLLCMCMCARAEMYQKHSSILHAFFLCSLWADAIVCPGQPIRWSLIALLPPAQLTDCGWWVLLLRHAGVFQRSHSSFLRRRKKNRKRAASFFVISSDDCCFRLQELATYSRPVFSCHIHELVRSISLSFFSFVACVICLEEEKVGILPQKEGLAAQLLSSSRHKNKDLAAYTNQSD